MEKSNYYINKDGNLVKKVGKSFHEVDAISVNKNSKRVFFTKSKQDS